MKNKEQPQRLKQWFSDMRKRKNEIPEIKEQREALERAWDGALRNMFELVMGARIEISEVEKIRATVSECIVRLNKKALTEVQVFKFSFGTEGEKGSREEKIVPGLLLLALGSKEIMELYASATKIPVQEIVKMRATNAQGAKCSALWLAGIPKYDHTEDFIVEMLKWGASPLSPVPMATSFFRAEQGSQEKSLDQFMYFGYKNAVAKFSEMANSNNLVSVIKRWSTMFEKDSACAEILLSNKHFDGMWNQLKAQGYLDEGRDAFVAALCNTQHKESGKLASTNLDREFFEKLASWMESGIIAQTLECQSLKSKVEGVSGAELETVEAKTAAKTVRAPRI